MSNLNLTPAQEYIYNRIQKSNKIQHRNSHHASGGTFFWENTGEVVRQKPFWNLMEKMYGFEEAYKQGYQYIIKKQVEIVESIETKFVGIADLFFPMMEDEKFTREEPKLILSDYYHQLQEALKLADLAFDANPTSKTAVELKNAREAAQNVKWAQKYTEDSRMENLIWKEENGFNIDNYEF